MAHNILRLPQVKAKSGLPTSGIYKRISEGAFPKQINLGGRTVGWLESDIDAWIDKRLAISRALRS